MGTPLENVLRLSEARESKKWLIEILEDYKSFGNLPGEFRKLPKVERDSQSPRNTWQDSAPPHTLPSCEVVAERSPKLDETREGFDPHTCSVERWSPL